jgi:hypothetical protein
MSTTTSSEPPKRTPKSKHEREEKEKEREVKQVFEISYEEWLKMIYDVASVSNDDIMAVYEIIRYKGFKREVILHKLYERVRDKQLVMQIVIACALLGPVRAHNAKLSNGQTIADLGIPSSGQKGSENLSCARITASTADLAAYYLKKIDVPKRIMSDCPGWLQFPSAGAIKLPSLYRQMHIDFSRKFSPLIGGVFNEQIYLAMEQNSYLNDQLKLFE